MIVKNIQRVVLCLLATMVFSSYSAEPAPDRTAPNFDTDPETMKIDNEANDELWNAVRAKKLSEVITALNNDISVLYHREGTTTLFEAGRVYCYGILKALINDMLSKGEDINYSNRDIQDGKSLLHMMAMSDEIKKMQDTFYLGEILSKLKDNSINLDAPDNWGWTPVMEAADAGNSEWLRLLLKDGASPDTASVQFKNLGGPGWPAGTNALILSCFKDAPFSAARLLVSSGFPEELWKKEDSVPRSAASVVQERASSPLISLQKIMSNTTYLDRLIKQKELLLECNDKFLQDRNFFNAILEEEE